MKLDQVSGGWSLRLRFGVGKRLRLFIPLEQRSEAEKRARGLSDLATLLAGAGKHAEAAVILPDGASQPTEALFLEVDAFARELCAKAAAKQKAGPAPMTFRELGEKWTSGTLHRSWPDHVKLKSSAADDVSRLAKLYVTVGSVPLAAFGLADAEAAMAALPPDLMPATRRHYAQLLAKVLRLAVYPCKVIAHSPLPVGFIPKIGAKKAKAWLYPSEDAMLLACRDVPLQFRLLYGFLAREGMRYGEAMRLTWADLDLARGVVTLDVNKTEDPRAWALTPGVPEALSACRPARSSESGALVFARATSDKPAELFRKHLKAAGVQRAELYRRSENRIPIRVHDLRSTFVTLALAVGRSEQFVADRTGHRSSQMIGNYRRAARTAAELNLGSLKPLNDALGLGQSLVRNSEEPTAEEAELISNIVAARPGGFEPPTTGFEVRPDGGTNGHQRGFAARSCIQSGMGEHGGPPEQANLARTDLGQNVDPIEAALAEALRGATAAGRFDVVAQLASELQARRIARQAPEVTSIATARAKRNGGQQ